MTPQTILCAAFAATIIAFLVVDLGFLNRQAHRISFRSALIQSLFWIGISSLYAMLVWYCLGSSAAAEFTTAYVTEKMLSVDNLFVILLVFRYLGIDEKYYHRVLYWGVLGAVVFRGLFIGLGSVVVSHFHWVLYLFGAFLLYTGIKLFKGDDDNEPDFEQNKILKFAKRHFSITTDDHGSKFVARVVGGWTFTMLAVALLMVETTDILFAFDSIPAVFTISQNALIIFTSNIFAVMGLRALFFLVENILTKFHFLQKGLSCVLVFIGLKMVSGIVGFSISPIISFSVVIGILLASVGISVLVPKKNI